MDAKLIEKLKILVPGVIVAVEGFSGSGKTSLAQRISISLNIQYIDTDCYIIKNSDSDYYLSLLDIDHLKEVVNSFIQRNKSLLFVGICAQETLRMLGFRPGYRIYVKQVSSSGLWHPGLHMEDFINGCEPSGFYQRQPHKSDMEYHLNYKPQDGADFIYEHVRD